MFFLLMTQLICGYVAVMSLHAVSEAVLTRSDHTWWRRGVAVERRTCDRSRGRGFESQPGTMA